jgi:hypothetical protein
MLHLGSVILFCVILGFRRGVNKVFALLGCYTAFIGIYGSGKLSVPSSRVPLEDGTDSLPRNVSNLITNQRCITPQKSEDLILFC